ncbi:MAG: ABC transporter permease [Candidatus Heimdallarchaeota archaeon]
MVQIFMSLFSKELKETKIKFLVALLSFLFLGLLGILLIYMLPTLMPPEMVIPIQYSALEAYQTSIGDILQIGTLIITLLSMDAIAGERERKTLELLLIKPTSRFSIIISKFLSRSLIILVAVLGAAIPTWAYTTYLFGELSLSAVILTAIIITLLLVFVCSITITYSILVKSQFMAAIGGIVTSAVLASLTMLPEPWNALTPFHYGNSSAILQETIAAATYLQNSLIISTFVATVMFLNLMIFSKIYIQ